MTFKERKFTMETKALDVLRAVHGKAGKSFIRIIDDTGSNEFKSKNYEVALDDYSECETELKNYNELGYGVFFTVNSGGNNDASISMINAQFVEMDHGSRKEQMEKIEKFPLEPSMIIETQKSYHVYYMLDESADKARFETIQKQLVKYFDGDPACVNPSRVMRLPGFWHCKTEDKVMVKCVSFHPERRYSQDQLTEVLPSLNEATYVHTAPGFKGIQIPLAECDFLKHCEENAKTLSEPHWYAMITNLADFEGGADQIHRLSCSYPNYTKEETDAKISHYYESGTFPITCKKINEWGFSCPKYESGECKAKSPADLRKKPVEIDVLREILKKQPVTSDAIKDIQTAKDFIFYLSNSDETIAEAFIKNDLRNYFRFDDATTKALIRTDKEKRKADVHCKKAGSASDLPPWYESGNNGIKFMPGILADVIVKEQDYIFTAGQFYMFSDGVYKEISRQLMRKMIKEKMIPAFTKAHQIQDTENQVSLLTYKGTDEINNNPYLINVKNGIYDVSKDTLIPHSADILSTVQLAVNYKPEADCPKFKKFLEEAMQGDMEQVGLIQEILGYLLIPITKAQKCFVLVGVAAAGKSVLLGVINEVILGRENVSNVAWQALNERFKTAELFGKLANIFADLPTKNIDDNGIFKALVGEDYITAERKNRDPFSFKSTARLVFSCNSIPANYGDRSEGFYRRLLIITFEHAVPEEKRDPDIIEQFKSEADGIFMFALEGLRRLIANHFKFSETEKNKVALQLYREQSDSVLSFVKECCELDPKRSVGSTEFFNAYQSYCEESGLRPCSQKKLVSQILTTFPEISSGRDSLGKRRVLNGITITEI